MAFWNDKFQGHFGAGEYFYIVRILQKGYLSNQDNSWHIGIGILGLTHREAVEYYNKMQ